MASETLKDNEEIEMFPGCTIQNRIPFLEKSARFTFEKLGIKSSVNPDFGCCPDPVGVHNTDHQTWLTLGARNLSLAEKENRPIVSLCNGCTETLKGVKVELDNNFEEMKIVQDRLTKVGKTYEGTTDVYHFVVYLHEVIGLEKIKSLVVKPLTGLRTAVHPGCHYARPHTILNNGDDPMHPFFLKDILKTIGATVVDYQEEMMCCASGVERNNPTVAINMNKRKFEDLQFANPDVLVVNCPSCFQQLEVAQRNLNKKFEMNVKIPVMYITELMAIAFGGNMKELGFKFHQIKPIKLLKEKGFE